MHKPIFKTATIRISIQELDISYPIQAFVINTIINLAEDITIPFTIVFYRNIHRKKSVFFLNFHVFYNRIEFYFHFN
jgi:hypothetical protein